MLRVEVDISELDITRLHKNMPCRITPDAYKDRNYTGHIMWLDPGANYSKATVQVKVRIDNPDEFLRVEGSAKVGQKWTYKGKKHSYINARCETGHFVVHGAFSFKGGPEDSPERLRLFSGRIAQGLNAAAAREFRAAVESATEQGTMLWAEPYHAALGIKP